MKNSKGVIVTKIYPNTPAEKAGIQVGDIVTEVNGFKINNENSMFSVFHEFRAGQTITLQIVRDDEELTKTMKLVKL